jgi:hypothetical protein
MFTANDDIIQVTDIIERIEGLELLIDNNPKDIVSINELKTLNDIMFQMSEFGGDIQWNDDWYPSYIINDKYFEKHTKELIDDCYGPIIPLDKATQWPYTCVTIDYKKAANELKADYSYLDFDGTFFWFRK